MSDTAIRVENLSKLHHLVARQLRLANLRDAPMMYCCEFTNAECYLTVYPLRPGLAQPASEQNKI